ncbi:MAG TPA: amino acid permease [Gammaproteobacteria bacterium]|nr:amino acid permease [Gammaproteobacteria bacterium]
MSFTTKLKHYVIGDPLNPFSPNILRHISLVAFLAWIGLGADGLSSTCYGPEEAFVALGHNSHLALYIALATAITVFIISLGYNQVIELFPSGGGGYKVATQLLGSHIGLISGAALIIDYVLTIAVSVASGTDSFFSMLPKSFWPYKLLAESILLILMMIVNLRGMKESIKLILPIFLGFVVIHFGLIVYGIAVHSKGLIAIIPDTVNETQTLAASIGWLPLIAIMLHAYSLGSGTYTGLEAVSNNVNRLSEPRVRTGKWTMFYMAVSLSFTAAGIILLYLLWNAVPTPGKTLNAVVFHSILGDSNFGKISLYITLALEAGLLLVAANTGFLAGPSVLANMAVDSWLPNRFRHLSTRLVIQNGLILFGISALLILLWSGGRVSLLVILYSINVFITFSLSLLGLSVFWAKQRSKASPRWPIRLAFSIFAFLITSSILCVTLATKFESGGWFTVIITCAVIGLCLLIKKHYISINKKLAELDAQLKQPITEKASPPLVPDLHQPTAVIFVGKSFGVGMHTLLCVSRIFPRYFKNFIFVSVGIVDVESFTAGTTLEKMTQEVNDTLSYFVAYCQQYGIAAESYSAFGTDTVEKLTQLSEEVAEKYPNCIFFASKLIFEHDNWVTRILHNETPTTLQRQLHLQGKELMILPMKI